MAGCRAGSDDCRTSASRCWPARSSRSPLREPPASPKAGLDKIEHIVVIYAENRSFDHLYGLFPAPTASPTRHRISTRRSTTTASRFPASRRCGRARIADPAFPSDLPNRPFRIDAPPINLPLAAPTRDLIHKFYPHQEQINGGRNDRFAEVSDAGGLAMGYYDGSKLPMWKWAQEYTLADHFFMGAFGDSYLNHFWLICACTPRDPNPPASHASHSSTIAAGSSAARVAAVGAAGPRLLRAGEFTPDGYSVSTRRSHRISRRACRRRTAAIRASPVPSKRGTLPPQTQKTIGDTLSAKGISWAWYAAHGTRPSRTACSQPRAKRMVIYNDEPGAPYFVTHHQPFNYFARFAPGTADRERHLKDYTDLVAGIETGELPAVAFYKPQGTLNEHPGYTDVLSGDLHIAELVAKIKASPLWASTAIIVTYDENGGFWDHVAPPKGDRWGPGTRIPAIIVSPFAKARLRRSHVLRHDVDHQVHHAALRSRAAARRAAERRRPDRGVRFRAHGRTRPLPTLAVTRDARASPARSDPARRLGARVRQPVHGPLVGADPRAAAALHGDRCSAPAR